MKTDVYEQVTNKIIEQLEQGVVPWRKPWRNGLASMPKNLISGKTYQGINVLLLMMEDFDNPHWVTYKQAANLGGHVRKGEKGTRIVFWKFLEREDEEGEAKKIPMARTYTVFNLEQCEGLTPQETPEPEAQLTDAQAIIANWKDKPEVRESGGKACYSPTHDIIWLPTKQRFNSEDEYYSTYFHEAIHATGHKTRLDRDGVTETAKFGSHEYSKEELIAEMGAAFLSAHANIKTTLTNSAAYIKGWLEKLKSDRKLLISAAGKAQKATNYVLGE